MQLGDKRITAFVDRIRHLPQAARYSHIDLLTDDFLVASDGNLAIYYAPFDWINTSARLVVVGITPGWGQMQESFQAFKTALDEGLSVDQAFEAAKKQASFAGSMRRNLVSMLSDLGVPSLLGIKAATSIFTDRADLIHSTSAIRYPVFVDGNNYSGHRPTIDKSNVLRRFVVELLRPELAALESALVIPLRGAVEIALRMLIDLGDLDERRVLFGFPHPSGSNGHRGRQFAERKADLEHKAAVWFEG